jgi:hypothetical protein
MRNAMVKPDWEDTRRQLIETYKTLNFKVRGRSEQELTADHGGDSVKAEVGTMRTHELQFAKALTTALAGDASGLPKDAAAEPVFGTEGAEESATVLISQFGNARATTLNTIQSVTDDVWDRPLIENRRMHDLAKELVESDRKHMEKIRRMLGV